jgi:ABC-2 type transport system ATP-binding protein
MEEAQRLCRRTAIIDHGKILAIGTLAQLIQRVKARRDVVLEAEDLSPERISRLAHRLGDVPCTRDENRLTLNIANTACSLLEVVRASDEAGIKATKISLQEPNLETVFLELTGRMLRD